MGLAPRGRALVGKTPVFVMAALLKRWRETDRRVCGDFTSGLSLVPKGGLEAADFEKFAGITAEKRSHYRAAQRPPNMRGSSRVKEQAAVDASPAVFQLRTAVAAAEGSPPEAGASAERREDLGNPGGQGRTTV